LVLEKSTISETRILERKLKNITSHVRLGKVFEKYLYFRIGDNMTK